jgi:hypothetical protein
VGVFRCVFERTISKKSAAVGTGAIALRPLVDIVVSTGQGERCFFKSEFVSRNAYNVTMWYRGGHVGLRITLRRVGVSV